jgi:esterase/lipase superfamily enzyme
MADNSSHPVRLAAMVVLAFILFGCGAQVGVLQPIPLVAPDATRLDVLVATTRAPAQDPAVLFSGERGAASITSIRVSIPPDHARDVGQVQWPRQVPPDPAREFAVLGVTSLPENSQLDGWVRQHAVKSRRALVFVHGFNTSFERSLIWFAQIAHDAGADAAPVLFSWPSRGSVLGYTYDRESTHFSRDAFEDLLRALSRNSSIDEITIIAHSMGAWLTTETLRQMAVRDGAINSKIRNVVLASPDVDVDVFRAQFARFGKSSPKFTVFVSRRDRALRFSRWIAGNVDRLGVLEPGAKVWLAEKGVDVIDLTDAPARNWTRHSKFSENKDVVWFLGANLINTSSDNAEGSLGELIQTFSFGVTQGIGSAAGAVLAAPIAAVSP